MLQLPKMLQYTLKFSYFSIRITFMWYKIVSIFFSFSRFDSLGIPRLLLQDVSQVSKVTNANRDNTHETIQWAQVQYLKCKLNLREGPYTVFVGFLLHFSFIVLGINSRELKYDSIFNFAFLTTCSILFLSSLVSSARWISN